MQYKALLILFCLFLIGTNEVKCQHAIEINYSRSTLAYTDSLGTYPAIEATYKPRMLFNDSFALVYFYSNSDNKKLRGKEIGRKMLHHETFYDFITGEKLGEIISQGKEKYVLKINEIANNWQYLNEERTILNKTCHAALSVNNNNDSILIWYTKDLAFKKGPLFYDGLPGVVLEVYDQKWNQYFRATEIREIDIRIVPPQGAKISMSEWEKIRKPGT